MNYGNVSVQKAFRNISLAIYGAYTPQAYKAEMISDQPAYVHSYTEDHPSPTGLSCYAPPSKS